MDKTVGVIEESAVVVAFENCAGIKSCYNLIDEDESDPILAIAKRYLKIGCAVMTPNDIRKDSLTQMIGEFSADGVVDINLLCCTPYNVESREIKSLCDSLKIPYMHIETDYSQSDSQQFRTRLNAFIEMLNGGL